MIDKPPSKEDLQVLALQDIILHRSLVLQQYYEWTWEETLRFALAVMIEDRQRLLKELIKMHSERPIPFIVVPKGATP